MWTTIHREVTKKLVCLFLAVSEEKQKSKTRDFPGGPVKRDTEITALANSLVVQ